MARYRLPLVDPRGLRVLAAAWLVGISASGFSQAADGKPPFTISKETTYLTEPLRKDGYVDYVAALNKRSSEGVTPENNAAVPFWKAMGPEEILPEYRDKYFEMLGIPPLPESGDYFFDLRQLAPNRTTGAKPAAAGPETKARDDAWSQLDEAKSRPWSSREFPALAEWLAANDAPLALVVEASKRPRRYDPLCCSEGIPLIAVLLPAIQHYRNVALALCARAMLRLDEGRVDDAWRDLLSVHRLARLVGQGPTLVDALVATSVEEMACAADQALLQHARLAPGQLARIREDLDRLPAMPARADKIDSAERFTYLDNVFVCSREGLASLGQVPDMVKLPDGSTLELSEWKGLKKTIHSLVRHGAGTEIDWDVVLRLGNSWYDWIAGAYRQPTRAQRREALRKLTDDLAALRRTAEDAESLDKLIAADPRKALSERLGQVLLVMFIDDFPSTAGADDRQTMRSELNELGFALAAYRANRGAYPAKLTDLVPKYVAEVPKDLFTDGEPHYRTEGDGFVLYSVGVNGRDDGAKSYKDGPKENGYDDLVVRVRAAEPK
ncbi:MAG: hypothetical protein JW809_05145 [Pirellulales bacterium]|nr:hypothetical protein [Pirellulales bacterium]